MTEKYGNCAECGESLMATLFIDYERDDSGMLTGRQRIDVDYLFCPLCGEKYCVDDTFAQPWHYAK